MKKTFTFENIDSVVFKREFEREGGVMGLKDADVIVQECKLVAWVGEESTVKLNKNQVSNWKKYSVGKF